MINTRRRGARPVDDGDVSWAGNSPGRAGREREIEAVEPSISSPKALLIYIYADSGRIKVLQGRPVRTSGEACRLLPFPAQLVEVEAKIKQFDRFEELGRSQEVTVATESLVAFQGMPH